jgi:hypothetical protein
MHRSWLALAAVLCSTPALAQNLGPIAPAAEGKMQCYSPDVVAKTCAGIGVFKFAPNGVIENQAEALLSSSPAIVMRSVYTVRIKGRLECTRVRPRDLAAASFVVDGRLASPAETAALRSNIAAANTSVIGREACEGYLPGGEALTARMIVGGTPRPDLDRKMIWVSPADGYQVAP